MKRPQRPDQESWQKQRAGTERNAAAVEVVDEDHKPLDARFLMNSLYDSLNSLISVGTLRPAGSSLFSLLKICLTAASRASLSVRTFTAHGGRCGDSAIARYRSPNRYAAIARSPGNVLSHILS